MVKIILLGTQGTHTASWGRLSCNWEMCQAPAPRLYVPCLAFCNTDRRLLSRRFFGIHGCPCPIISSDGQELTPAHPREERKFHLPASAPGPYHTQVGAKQRIFQKPNVSSGMFVSYWEGLISLWLFNFHGVTSVSQKCFFFNNTAMWRLQMNVSTRGPEACVPKTACLPSAQ